MAATAAATCFTSIVTPPSSSSLPFLSSDHSFSHFSPKPTKPLLKNLALKPHNFTLSPLPLLFPIHLCHSSVFSDTQDTITDDDLEENQDGEDEDEEEEETEQEEDGFEEYDDNATKGSYSADDCKLYVGNLSYSMTSAQLAEVFAEAGQVKSVEIIYDKMTDRSRGFGFVTMASIDDAREAVGMFDGSQVGGRTVKVNFPEVPRGGERKVMGPKIRSSNQSFVDTPHKLYVGNLGWGVTTQGLRDAFAEQEGFLSAKVIYERDSGRSRGFGFISFSSANAAQSALSAMNGMELEGRPLRLNMAADRTRSNTVDNVE